MKHTTDSSLIRIIGRWNPYAITEAWIKQYFQNEDQTKKIKSEPKALVSQPGIKYNLKDFALHLSETNLIFIVNKYDRDTLSMVEKNVFTLLRQFPHTPLNAMGLNYTFEGSMEEFEGLLLNNTIVEKISKHGFAKKFNLRYTIEYENDEVNIVFTVKDNNVVEININFHFKVKTPKECIDALFIEGFQPATEAYFEKSKNIVTKILGLKINE